MSSELDIVGSNTGYTIEMDSSYSEDDDLRLEECFYSQESNTCPKKYEEVVDYGKNHTSLSEKEWGLDEKYFSSD